MSDAPPERRERLSTVEAVSRICWHLWHGEGMTTAQAADLIGYTHGSAWRILTKVSRYWPIYQDDDGLWQLMWLDDPPE